MNDSSEPLVTGQILCLSSSSFFCFWIVKKKIIGSVPKFLALYYY